MTPAERLVRALAEDARRRVELEKSEQLKAADADILVRVDGSADPEEAAGGLGEGVAMRDTKRLKSPPMTADTAERLYAALEARYPGKVWRTIEVCPVAVVKTIDNETDAQETLRRLSLAAGPANGEAG